MESKFQNLILADDRSELVVVQERDYGEVYFYFSPRVKHSSEHYFYSFLSLMGEVGGYVGLFLGFSFWHLAEWMTLLIKQKIKGHEKVLMQQKKRREKE